MSNNNYEIEESEEVDDELKYQVENCVQELTVKEKENIDTLFRAIRSSNISDIHWSILLKVFLMKEVPKTNFSFIKQNLEYLDLNEKKLDFVCGVLCDNRKKLAYFLEELIKTNMGKGLYHINEK